MRDMTLVARRWFGLVLALSLAASARAAAVSSAPPAPTASAPATCIKTVAWHHSPPYSARDAAGQLQGADIDLLTLLLARLGCKPRFVEMPLQRALLELEAGRVDLRASTAHTRERERAMRFTRALDEHPNRLYIASSFPDRARIERLGQIIGTEFRLAVLPKASYGEEFEALRQDPAFAARLVPVSSQAAGWRMLLAGRVDGLIANDATAEPWLAEPGAAARVWRSEVVLRTSPSAIAMSRASVDADFASRLDRALADALARGDVRAIYQRHGLCAGDGGRQRCK